MSIQPLRPDGTLPPGNHPATLTEILAAFPPLSPERQLLNQVLQDVVNQLLQLRTQAQDMIVFIDGSYVTSKPTPSDIDIVIRSDLLDENTLRQTLWSLPNGRTVDLFVDRFATPLANTIYDLFTHTITNQEKGIIQLDF